MKYIDIKAKYLDQNGAPIPNKFNGPSDIFAYKNFLIKTYP
jgi:hypothetical protein